MAAAIYHNTMKYLITGSKGFIGSHIAKRLHEEGHKVVLVDNAYGGVGCFYWSNNKYLLSADISKPETYTYLVMKEPGFDAVLHLAAQPSAAISFEDPVVDMHTNLYGTLLLLQWCLAKKIKRFVFASTMGVYGTRFKAVNEESHCMPQSFYGVNKLASEGYIKLFRKWINTTILRLFTVYGPGQNLRNREQGMVSIYLSYILGDEPIIVKGSKDRWRDFVYVDDVADAFCGVLHNPATYNQTYNIGTGNLTFVDELINLLLLETGKKDYPIHYLPSTKGDIWGACADISRIKEDIGWTPKVSLEEGIKKTVAWATKEDK
jgi:UDP-glucose 4-epimerase